MVGRKSKPTEVRSKESIYRVHLKDRIGDKRLDEIDVGEIARLRAALVQGGELGDDADAGLAEPKSITRRLTVT